MESLRGQPTAIPTGRLVTATLIGTAIEYYDFYLYATAAALVLGPQFFPGESEAAQRLSAFASFSIAFIARPLGAGGAALGATGLAVGSSSAQTTSPTAAGTPAAPSRA